MYQTSVVLNCLLAIAKVREKFNEKRGEVRLEEYWFWNSLLLKQNLSS